MSSLSARRADFKVDCDAITSLFDSSLAENFGISDPASISNLIETSVLAVTIVDENNVAVGFASFLDAVPPGLQGEYPKCSAKGWTDWFGEKYRNEEFKVSNTVWLTCFLSKPGIDEMVATRILQTVFSTLPHLSGILALIKPGDDPFAPVSTMFEKLPRVADSGADEPDIYACPRVFFVNPLTVRIARIEDHDDLAPIFDSNSEVLTSIYGEFFLAGMIENQDEHSHCLVGDVDSRAVGLMAFTDQMDVNLLRKCFDLSLYDGLRKEGAAEEAPGKSSEPPVVATEPAPEAITPAAEPKADAAVTEASKGDDEAAAAPTEAVPADAPAEADSTKVPTLALPGAPAPAADAVGADGEEAQGGEPGGGTDIEGETPSSSTREEEEETEAVEEDTNCFSITLFCIDENYETRGIDLLRPAFDLYSNCDYCLLTLPHTAREIPLITHMTQIQPLPNNTFGQALYLIHRDSIDTDLTVDAVNGDTLAQSKELLQEMANGSEIEAMVSQSISNPEQDLVSFTVSAYGQVVGVVILKTQGSLDSLRDNFAIEDFMALQDLSENTSAAFDAADDAASTELHLSLEYLVLNPLFQRQSAFVCREILRLTGRQVIHYKAYPTKSPGFQPYQDVLNLFVQVRPRRKPRQPANLVTLIPSPYEKEAKLLSTSPRDSFALHLTTRRLLSMPKVQTNARVVVVGASVCGLSFLESLLLISDLNYAHITLISSSGLPSGRSTRDASPQFLPWNLYLDDQAMDNLVLESRVRVVKGNLSDILCEEKLVVMDSSARIPYDFLVLTPGMQNSIKEMTMQRIVQRKEEARQRRIAKMLRAEESARLAELAAAEAAAAAAEAGESEPVLEDVAEGEGEGEEEEEEELEEEEEAGPDVPLEGVFSFSQESDVISFLNWNSNQDRRAIGKDNPVVVHGFSTKSLCVIRGLLDCKFNPSHLVWLYAKDLYDSAWCNGDDRVTRRTVKAVQALGVRIMSNSFVADLRRDRSGRVTHVLVESTKESGDEGAGRESSELSCYAFLGCSQPDVNKNVFFALANNSLVYDGRMVVDHEFKTQDPFVYGAGTVAKFSRRYGQTLHMDQFDSREVGQKLAESVLRAIDPLTAAEFTQEEAGPAAPQMLPALGVAPKAEEGIFPGGLHYFHARKPTLRPLTKPKKLTTTNDSRSCTLVFDDLNYLHSITYLGTTAVQSRNLMHLVGLPASYMNRILYRYHENEITDLVTFLQAPWATALYHESFPLMRDELKSFGVESQEFQAIQAAFTKFRESEDFHKLSSQMVPELAAELDQEAKETVQIQLLKFLQTHANHLPGYIVPAHVPPPADAIAP